MLGYFLLIDNKKGEYLMDYGDMVSISMTSNQNLQWL